MTVAELIAALQKEDPKALVCVAHNFAPWEVSSTIDVMYDHAFVEYVSSQDPAWDDNEEDVIGTVLGYDDYVRTIVLVGL